jgi:ribose-phosphate pyrophosphokinase
MDILDRTASPDQRTNFRSPRRADLLQTVGVSHIITIDLHTPQIQGFFSCPVDNLSTIHLFAGYYLKKLKQLKLIRAKLSSSPPITAALTEGRDLATALPGSQLAIVDKRRPSPNEAEVVNIVGDVEDKTCIIIDDIIDTGGTIIASTKEL